MDPLRLAVGVWGAARRLRTLVALSSLAGAAVTIDAAAQLQSPEMRQLADRAGFGPQVVRWCPVDPAPGRPRAYAVAVKSPAGGGRYLVLETDGTVLPLLPYSGDVDLSCYPRERADEVSAALKASTNVVQGQLVPRWNATVICAFVESTQAVCWQFDPDRQSYVEVGRWRT